MLKLITVCIILSIAFANIRVAELGDNEDQKYIDACASRNMNEDPIGYKAIADQGNNITDCTTLTLRGIGKLIG